MSNFKPCVHLITAISDFDYQLGMTNSPNYTKSYSTYAELKKNIGKHLAENLVSKVSVSRSRRGEWGEWFEDWELIDGKPTITKQGWM